MQRISKWLTDNAAALSQAAAAGGAITHGWQVGHPEVGLTVAAGIAGVRVVIRVVEAFTGQDGE